MVLLFAAATAAYSAGRSLADDGHDHGSAAACATYEFGGIYAVPIDAGQVYKFSAPMVGGVFPEASMNVVVLPVADATQATLDAQKGAAVDGMGHTPCTDVEPGDTVVAGTHKCSKLHIEGTVTAEYTLQNAELTTGFVAIFLQHDPAELSATFNEATLGAIEPTVQVGARPCPAAAAAGCTTAYEWGGIFATPASAGVYTWTAYKKDEWDVQMKVVVLPVADASEATLAAAKAEAIDGMGHTPCTDVEPGETIVPGDHKCSVLHIEGDGASVSYTIQLTDAEGAAVTHLAIFTEHSPSEFEVAGGHYLTSKLGAGESGSGAAAAEDVEPAFNVAAADPVCPPPPSPSSPPPASKGGDDPCFSETATVCRLDDAALLPATAYAQCFGEAEGGAAVRVPMRALKAGDLVLSSPTEVTRVIVNQHAAVRLASSVVILEHATGSLALTPDHVLWVDGGFRAAAEVREGSVLAPATKVSKVGTATHAVVNPLTTSGTILAAGPTGAPVLASVFPEWIAHLLHGASLPYPLPLSGAAAASYLFPAAVQAYYDAVLEPFFTSTAPGLKELKAAVPAPVALTILLGFDVVLVAGFSLWSLTLKGAMALLAVGLVAKARQAKA